MSGDSNSGVVYVIDNNLDYSDHSIIFVLVPEDRRPEVDGAIAEWNRVAALAGGWHKEGWTVIAVSADLDWRAPYAMKPVQELLDDLRDRTEWERELNDDDKAGG